MSKKPEICVVKTRNPLIAGSSQILLAIGAAVAAKYLVEWLGRGQQNVRKKG